MKPAGALAAALMPMLMPALFAVAGVLGLGACTSCQSTVSATALTVVAAGSFDGAAIDPASHRLYLADRTTKGIDVVDVSSATPRFASTVEVGGIPNGIAVAPDQERLYAGLESGEVAVVDTNAMRLVETIPVSTTGVDLLDYSRLTHRVFAGTGDGGEVVTIDATTDTVGARVTVGGPVEQPRFDPADGMLYVTVPRQSAVLQADPVSGRITRTFVVSKCDPKGLAINPGSQLAMLACGSSVGLLNLKTGAHSVTHDVQGGDIVSYDSAADRFVIASPHGGSDSTVGVFGGKGDFIGSVKASPKAHAAVLDSAHGLVYAPSSTGLMSFAPGACAAPPWWLNVAGGFAVFAVPFLALVLFLVFYARRMRRPRGVKGPTMRDLQEEDLAAERERMRALEDSIYGAEP